MHKVSQTTGNKYNETKIEPDRRLNNWLQEAMMLGY